MTRLLTIDHKCNRYWTESSYAIFSGFNPLFSNLKNWLGEKIFGSNDEFMAFWGSQQIVLFGRGQRVRGTLQSRVWISKESTLRNITFVCRKTCVSCKNLRTYLTTLVFFLVRCFIFRKVSSEVVLSLKSTHWEGILNRVHEAPTSYSKNVRKMLLTIWLLVTLDLLLQLKPLPI